MVDIPTERLDIQPDPNSRAAALFYGGRVGMLREAAGEQGCAPVVNTSSIFGKSGRPSLRPSRSCLVPELPFHLPGHAGY